MPDSMTELKRAARAMLDAIESGDAGRIQDALAALSAAVTRAETDQAAGT